MPKKDILQNLGATPFSTIVTDAENEDIGTLIDSTKLKLEMLELNLT